MAQLVTVPPFPPQCSSSCSISFINTSNSINHSSSERFSICWVDSLVRSQWRFTNGVTSAASRNESPSGEASVQRHFDSFLFTNIVCALCSSSTQSTRDLHARLLRATRMRTRMKSMMGGEGRGGASLMDSAAAPPFLLFLFAIIKLCGLPRELIISLCHLISC